MDERTEGNPRAILDVQHLSVGFRTSAGFGPVVDDVSFSVGRQRTLCMVGESGSGKSVTCYSALGLLARNGRRTGGRILFEGRDLAQLDERSFNAIRGREIGMVFQDSLGSLNPVHTVGVQMNETLAIHTAMTERERRARMLELLNLVGIAEPERRLHAYPHQLSGGMAQRVMIGMALACSPKLLIADEPTTALDVTIQKQILDLLNRLKSTLGMAILFVTHDLGVVAEIADDVIVMRRGKVVESGPVEAIFGNPQVEYTRELLGSMVRSDVSAPIYRPRTAA